jgi:hypothetical protein
MVAQASIVCSSRSPEHPGANWISSSGACARPPCRPADFGVRDTAFADAGLPPSTLTLGQLLLPCSRCASPTDSSHQAQEQGRRKREGRSAADRRQWSVTNLQFSARSERGTQKQFLGKLEQDRSVAAMLPSPTILPCRTVLPCRTDCTSAGRKSRNHGRQGSRESLDDYPGVARWARPRAVCPGLC